MTEQSGLGSAAHSSGARLFDYDRDVLADSLVCDVGIYPNDQKGPRAGMSGLQDAFGHLHPERFEGMSLYKNLGDCGFETESRFNELLLSPRRGRC